MVFIETPLQGAYIIEIGKIGDDRGFFGRSWCKNEMRNAGLDADIAQINTSLSRYKGTLRGLHFQVAPHQESKMIRCTRGSIHDVIVDLRPESPTFRQWFGVDLTADNHRSLYSPKGFAQGFITLEDTDENLLRALKIRARDGTLSPSELRMLKAICKRIGDDKCQAPARPGKPAPTRM